MKKYETWHTTSMRVVDIIIGYIIMMFIVWASASCSPLITAIIVATVFFRAVADNDYLRLCRDILQRCTSKINHTYGFKGFNFEQKVEVEIDEEEMRRNGLIPRSGEDKSSEEN